MKSKELLIILYRNPNLANVKTRLATSIGDAHALAIYLALVAHTRIITKNVIQDKAVFYSDYIDTEDNWNNKLYQKNLQSGKDLGEKMCHAFDWGFKSGYQSVALIGTDCFELTESIIQEAFKKLEDNEAVIGPAKGGGYYLLGMNKLHPAIFQNKKWDANSVGADIIHDLKKLKLDFALLDALINIDQESDLPAILKPK